MNEFQNTVDTNIGLDGLPNSFDFNPDFTPDGVRSKIAEIQAKVEKLAAIAAANDGFLLPHQTQYASQYEFPSKTYWSRSDEALRFSSADALAMHRDPFITMLIKHRQIPTALLEHTLVASGGDEDEKRKTLEQVRRVFEATPRFQMMKMILLEAIYYGKYGVQLTFKKKRIEGREFWVVADFEPVHGDSIIFKYDGTPGVFVGPKFMSLMNQSRLALVEQADIGPALFLKTPFWRRRFIVHKFEPTGTDYLYEGDLAGAVHGVGLRGRLFWGWYQRKEILAWAMDALQRISTNGMLIGYYPDGNAAARSAMLTTLKYGQQYGFTVAGVEPSMSGAPSNSIQHIEPAPVAYEVIMQFVQYVDSIMRQAILGQDLSTSAAPTGLGSGVAELQGQVRGDIILYDANNLAECLTSELLENLIAMNDWEYKGRLWRGELPFDVKLRFVTDRQDVDNRLKAAQTMVAQLGIDIDADKLLEEVGFSPPRTDDSSVLLKMQAAQAAMMQPGQGQLPVPGQGPPPDDAGPPPDDGGGPESQSQPPTEEQEDEGRIVRYAAFDGGGMTAAPASPTTSSGAGGSSKPASPLPKLREFKAVPQDKRLDLNLSKPVVIRGNEFKGTIPHGSEQYRSLLDHAQSYHAVGNQREDAGIGVPHEIEHLQHHLNHTDVNLEEFPHQVTNLYNPTEKAKKGGLGHNAVRKYYPGREGGPDFSPSEGELKEEKDEIPVKNEISFKGYGGKPKTLKAGETVTKYGPDYEALLKNADPVELANAGIKHHEVASLLMRKHRDAAVRKQKRDEDAVKKAKEQEIKPIVSEIEARTGKPFDKIGSFIQGSLNENQREVQARAAEEGPSTWAGPPTEADAMNLSLMPIEERTRLGVRGSPEARAAARKEDQLQDDADVLLGTHELDSLHADAADHFDEDIPGKVKDVVTVRSPKKLRSLAEKFGLSFGERATRSEILDGISASVLKAKNEAANGNPWKSVVEKPQGRPAGPDTAEAEATTAPEPPGETQGVLPLEAEPADQSKTAEPDGVRPVASPRRTGNLPAWPFPQQAAQDAAREAEREGLEGDDFTRHVESAHAASVERWRNFAATAPETLSKSGQARLAEMKDQWDVRPIGEHAFSAAAERLAKTNASQSAAPTPVSPPVAAPPLEDNPVYGLLSQAHDSSTLEIKTALGKIAGSTTPDSLRELVRGVGLPVADDASQEDMVRSLAELAKRSQESGKEWKPKAVPKPKVKAEPKAQPKPVEPVGDEVFPAKIKGKYAVKEDRAGRPNKPGRNALLNHPLNIPTGGMTLVDKSGDFVLTKPIEIGGRRYEPGTIPAKVENKNGKLITNRVWSNIAKALGKDEELWREIGTKFNVPEGEVPVWDRESTPGHNSKTDLWKKIHANASKEELDQIYLNTDSLKHLVGDPLAHLADPKAAALASEIEAENAGHDDPSFAVAPPEAKADPKSPETISRFDDEQAPSDQRYNVADGVPDVAPAAKATEAPPVQPKPSAADTIKQKQFEDRLAEQKNLADQKIQWEKIDPKKQREYINQDPATMDEAFKDWLWEMLDERWEKSPLEKQVDLMDLLQRGKLTKVADEWLRQRIHLDSIDDWEKHATNKDFRPDWTVPHFKDRKDRSKPERPKAKLFDPENATIADDGVKARTKAPKTAAPEPHSGIDKPFDAKNTPITSRTFSPEVVDKANLSPQERGDLKRFKDSGASRSSVLSIFETFVGRDAAHRLIEALGYDGIKDEKTSKDGKKAETTWHAFPKAVAPTEAKTASEPKSQAAPEAKKDAPERTAQAKAEQKKKNIDFLLKTPFERLSLEHQKALLSGPRHIWPKEVQDHLSAVEAKRKTPTNPKPPIKTFDDQATAAPKPKPSSRPLKGIDIENVLRGKKRSEVHPNVLKAVDAATPNSISPEVSQWLKDNPVESAPKAGPEPKPQAATQPDSQPAGWDDPAMAGYLEGKTWDTLPGNYKRMLAHDVDNGAELGEETGRWVAENHPTGGKAAAWSSSPAAQKFKDIEAIDSGVADPKTVWKMAKTWQDKYKSLPKPSEFVDSNDPDAVEVFDWSDPETVADLENSSWNDLSPKAKSNLAHEPIDRLPYDVQHWLAQNMGHAFRNTAHYEFARFQDLAEKFAKQFKAKTK